MGAFFSDLLTQTKAIWARLDGSQRLTVGAVLTAAAVGLIAIIWVANRPSYVVVHTAADAANLQEAQQALNQAGISYQPEGGLGLAVERQDLQLANQALTSAGVRTRSSTLDLGSEMGDMTASSKAREFYLDRKRHQIALNQIEGLAGVREASITAIVPKRRVFANESQAQPKGAVNIKLVPGASFTRMAAAAAEFLSSAVEVPLEAVVVINADTGEKWRANPDRGVDYTISDFEELQREVSRHKEEKAGRQLDIYDGKVRVAVSVELDPEWETRREDILPDEQPIVEQETSTDKTEDFNGASAGDPSLANSSQGATSGVRTSNETKKTKYYGKIGDLRRGRLAPDIERMTCSVLIHEDLEDKQAEIEGLIKAAIGWDQNRDPADGFQVLKDAFETELPYELVSEGSTMEVVEKWAPTAVQLLGVVLVLWFLRGMFQKPKKASTSRMLSMPEEPPPSEEDLSSDEVARRMRKEIERAITEDPNAVSKMVESWLAEVKA